MPNLYSPTGSLIVGTLESLSGRAEISTETACRLPDGTVDFDYLGYTEVFWDEQKTVLRNNQRVFLDEDGNEWTEDQLELRDQD